MGIELKLRSQLKLNLRLFMDMMFLREGGFTSVASGQQFIDGSDLSLLLPDTSADDLFGLSKGSVWQSPFRQFIYESGIPLDGTAIKDPPRSYSGVYIEGTLRTPDDITFGHKADFINGRIIFSNPQSLNLKVNADFSYREVRFGFERDFNNQFSQGFIESKYTTNPSTSMQLVYPSGFLQPFPAVFIEVDERDFEAYELGNRSLIIKDTVKFHVWALDDLSRDNIVDILSQQMRKVVPIVDFNRAPLPLSGIFNTLSPEYVPYQKLLLNQEIVTTVGSGHPVRYIAFIDKVNTRNLPSVKEFERSLVTYNISTYLNAPTTPFASLFGPIDKMTELGDTIFP